jgi:hypothetical protein
MKFFITTENGHIEDNSGERECFFSIESATNFVQDNHSDWCGKESQTYFIGTDNGVVWKTIKTITL